MAKKRREKHGHPKVPAQEQAESAAEGKAARKSVRAEARTKSAHTRRKIPNWPVLALALAGMALTAFLTGALWLGESLPYCEANSPCDVVQGSRWSHLLGVPISLWGFGTYAALGFVAARVRGLELHWKAVWTFSLIAVAVSLYLSAVALFVLDAACVYCLASTGIALALFAVVAWQSPAGLPDFAWPAWLVQTVAVAAIIVAAMHFYYSGWVTSAVGEEDPYLRALATHLDSTGAMFYGAFWCGNCQEQKEMFGASAERLPYVECAPGGRNAPLSPACAVQGISSFPTWVIGGRRYVGKLSEDELARHSGFVPPEKTN